MLIEFFTFFLLPTTVLTGLRVGNKPVMNPSRTRNWQQI